MRIHETGEHKVFSTIDWRCVFFNGDFCKAVKWDKILTYLNASSWKNF